MPQHMMNGRYDVTVTYKSGNKYEYRDVELLQEFDDPAHVNWHIGLVGKTKIIRYYQIKSFDYRRISTDVSYG